jgi:uncharacterized protein YjeT (DUF2065 family)
MLIPSPARAKHIAAMVLIGEGIMALLYPAKDDAAWKSGSKLMRGLAGRPGLTRTVGAAQIAVGVWWAVQQAEADANTGTKTGADQEA